MSCLRNAFLCSAVSTFCAIVALKPERWQIIPLEFGILPLMPDCSLCHDEPAATNHRWCLKCKNANEKERRRMVVERAYNRGAETMRSTAVETFVRIGRGGMTGLTAAEIVRGLALDH